PVTADVEPRSATTRRKEELYRKVAPVFDYDETTLTSWLQTWLDAFADIRRSFFRDNSEKMTQLQLMDRIGLYVQNKTGQTLMASDLLYLTENAFSQEIEDAFNDLAKPLLGRLVARTDLFPSYYSTGIIVRQINLGLNETL